MLIMKLNIHVVGVTSVLLLSSLAGLARAASRPKCNASINSQCGWACVSYYQFTRPDGLIVNFYHRCDKVSDGSKAGKSARKYTSSKCGDLWQAALFSDCSDAIGGTRCGTETTHDVCDPPSDNNEN